MSRTLGLVLLVAGASAAPVLADPPPQTYHLAVDVPTRLGGTDYTTSQIVRRSTANAYAVDAALPAGLAISALERRASDGVWMFSPTDPWSFGALTYLPNDVVTWNGTTIGLALQGAAVGLPADARIDAIYEAPTGQLLLSFDAPVRLGAVDYGRSDLVRVLGAGNFSGAWSGSAAGVPEYANLVGASRDATGELVLAFDVPLSLAGVDYLPGDLLRWTGGTFSLASRDASWPQDSELRDFTSTPAVGGVPSLTLAKSAGQIVLSWGAACGAVASTDYAVYEGTIGSWYSHTARYCSTGGALSSTFVPPVGNGYYLIAARNGSAEGSYGTNSGSVEIPQASNACVPQQIASCP